MIKIIEDKVLSNSEESQHIETVFEDKKGEENKWSWIRRTGDKNAVIVIATMDNKIVAIREYRVPVKKVIWQFPAGIIEEDELPEVAAARELKEETGLDIKKIIKKASPPVFSSAGITNEAVCFIFVEAKGTLSTKENEDTEDIQPKLLSQGEVKSILNDLKKK
jgi:ADP-ribose pyrophosphatase